MTTDTYSLTYDLGYELPFRRIDYDLTYYIVCSMPFEGFEDGLDDWPVWEPWTSTWIDSDLSSATITWDLTTESHSGTYAGRLYSDSIAAPGEGTEAQITIKRGITNDFNTIGFWYKVNISYGYDAEFYVGASYVTEDGYEEIVDLIDRYNESTCDWTYCEVNLNDIDIGTGTWGQIIPIIFMVYTYTYDDSECEIEVYIDDITTSSGTISYQDLTYAIEVPKIVTQSLKYCVSIITTPIELDLEYTTRPIWCNGGFETGDLTCWTPFYDDSATGATINVIEEAAYTGTYGCQIINTTPSGASELILYQMYRSDDWDIITFRYKIHEAISTNAYLAIRVHVRYWPSWNPGHFYDYPWEAWYSDTVEAGDWIDVTINRSVIEADITASLEPSDSWDWYPEGVLLDVYHYIYVSSGGGGES